MSNDYASEAHRIVSDALASLGGYQRHSDTDIFIVCPLHDDSAPSCGICVAPGAGIPIGWFYCFGCGRSGHWNTLADKLNLPRISGSDSVVSNVVVNKEKLTKRLAKMGMGADTVEMPSGVPFPYSRWRGIRGATVRQAGGVMAAAFRNQVRLYFPVERDVDGRYCEPVGVIEALLEKSKGQASYRMTRGSQVKDDGMFPLSLTTDMLGTGRYNAVVLVEGPRDALRLIDAGIPSLAVVSTTQWSARKAQDVAWLCRRTRTRPVVMMDGDDAGRKAQRGMVSDLLGFTYAPGKAAKIDLPEGDDPASAPKELVAGIRDRCSA